MANSILRKTGVKIKTVFPVVCMLASPACAEEYLHCGYRVGGSEVDSFDQTKKEAGAWLARMSSNNESRAYCEATDNSSTWNLLTKSYGGEVSLIKGLTESECDTMKEMVKPTGSSCNQCVIMIQGGDIKSAECFK